MKEIKFPEDIKIAYRSFKINDLTDRVGYDGEGEEIYGNMDEDKLEINIYKHRSQKIEEKMNSFLHECLHSGTHTYGLVGYLGGEECEEKAVNTFANIMTELLLRNPQLVEYIVKCSKNYNEE